MLVICFINSFNGPLPMFYPLLHSKFSIHHTLCIYNQKEVASVFSIVKKKKKRFQNLPLCGHLQLKESKFRFNFSLMWNKNNRGPSIVPSWTPDTTEAQIDLLILHQLIQFSFVEYNFYLLPSTKKVSKSELTIYRSINGDAQSM